MDALQGPEPALVRSGSGAETYPANGRVCSTSSPASGNDAAVQAAAPWSSLHGAKRIQAELKQLHEDLPSCYPFVRNLEVVGDNMHLWHLELCNFDDSTAGGRQLKEDLRKLQCLHSQDHLLLALEFPVDYPTSPFFARLVQPRCVMYTGHVTAGGSICLEALTNSGSSGSWQPSFCVGSMLNVIVNNMLECPKVFIQTATGPGGLTGPLRVEFNLGNPTYGYSSSDAKAAFDRTLTNHKRMGWGSPGSNQPRDDGTASTSSIVALPTKAAAAVLAVGGSSTDPVPVPDPAPTYGFVETAVMTSGQAGSCSRPLHSQQGPVGGTSSTSVQPIANTFGPSLSTEELRAEHCKRGIKRCFGAAAPLQPSAAVAAAAAAAAPSCNASASNTAGGSAAVLTAETASGNSGGSSTTHSTTLDIKYPPTWQHTNNRRLQLTELRLPGKAPPLTPWQLQQNVRSATLWQPAHTQQMSALEAAAVQQELKTMDVKTLQGQLQLSLTDALAALLLAEGDVKLAHEQVACCADNGGPAKSWTKIYAQVAVVGSSSAAAAAGAICSSQQGPAVLSEAHEVLRVARVQNPMLWGAYCAKERELQDRLGAAGVTEQQLFHGTSATAAAAIIQEGFDSRLNSASVYGRGTYFSGLSCTAIGYSRSKEARMYSSTEGSSSVTLTLLLARVLLGRQCQGKYGMKRPPAGYDSMHDNQPVGFSGDSRYHLVTDNSSAYPEYVITVRQ